MYILDLNLYRDADFAKEFRLTDTLGAAVDLTAATLECAVVDMPGGDEVLAPGTIDVIEASDGRFNLTLDGADYAAFGDLQTVVQVYYRVRLTLGGVQTNVLAGYVNLLPGV